jgi:DNA polymerase-3 subunit alpha
MTSCRTCYLKTHFPAEYLAAVLTSEMGYYGMPQYVAEAKRLGIRVLTPDINRSEYEFTVEYDEGSLGDIRVGLALVDALGPAALSSIVKARRSEGPFRSLMDFCLRVDLRAVTRPGIENLLRCGAFDFTGCNRRQLLAVLNCTMEAAKAEGCASGRGQWALLPMEQSWQNGVLDPSRLGLAPWGPREQMAAERDVLGLYVTRHPLEEYAGELRRMGVITTAEACLRPPQSVVSVAGSVASVRRQRTRKGRQMLLIVLQDQEGLLEAIVFPRIYEQFRDALQEDELVLARGRLDHDGEATKLVVQHLEWLDATVGGAAGQTGVARAG